jgi:glycosyltransferase involved in cell wall biosynthesis
MKGRLKVLIEAYECSPVRNHAPGSAWQILSRLARKHELWVITEKTQYEEEVRGFLSGLPDLAERIHFRFIPRRRRSWHKGARPVIPIRKVRDYRDWLRQSFEVARDLHSRERFDLAHHLRGDSFREPGFLWRLPVPFVWGPTGGIPGVPFSLMGVMGMRDRVLHTLRNLITAGQFHFSRTVRCAAANAACILAQSVSDQIELQKIASAGVRLVHEQAADPSQCAVHAFDGKRPLRVAWAGRCIGLKGVPILLRAACHPRLRGRVELHLAGDGPLRLKWQTLAKRLGIADQCCWKGWLAQNETLRMMSECDILGFPSMLEATSTTTMQALSLGLPVIALKLCGLEDVVTEACGVSVPVSDLRSVVADFANALVRMVENPSLVEALSHGACHQAKKFSWDSIASLVEQAYNDVVS